MIRGARQVSDVPFYKPVKGALPKRVVLVSPHENEHPATVPFQRAWADKLLTRDINVEEKVVTGMMERGWFLRRHILSTVDDNIVFANFAAQTVFALEDYLIRVRIMGDTFLNKDKGNTFLVEIHADRNRKDEDIYEPSGITSKRIENTRIFILGFQNLVNLCRGCTTLSSVWPEEIFQLAIEFAKLRGFDFKEAAREIKVKLRELSKSEKVIKVIEIPSDEVRLDENHPAFKLYYERDRLYIHPKKRVTDIEKVYCAVYRNSLGFTEQDIDHVSSVLVIPDSVKT